MNTRHLDHEIDQRDIYLVSWAISIGWGREHGLFCEPLLRTSRLTTEYKLTTY